MNRKCVFLVLGVTAVLFSTQLLAQEPRRVRVGSGVQEVKLVHNPAPAYPALAKQAGIQGRVFLEVLIGGEGKIKQIRVVSGHPLLAQAAVDAVREWEYRPTFLNNEPVEVATTVEVNFVLDGEQVSAVSDRTAQYSRMPALPSSADDARVRVNGELQESRLISKVNPEYPALARQARIQGVVRLEAAISKEGAVDKVQVISGHPLLLQPAIDAVRQWRYQPTLLNGEPVAVLTRIDVNFVLGDASAGRAATSRASDAEEKRIGLSGKLQQSALVHQVKPVYPPEAKQAGIQGTVRLLVTIGKTGNVEDISLISGAPELAPAAINAVRQWQYRPTYLNGEAVEVMTQVDVNFVLSQ